MERLYREKGKAPGVPCVEGVSPGEAAGGLAGCKASHVIGSRYISGFFRVVVRWMWSTVGEAVSPEPSPG